MFNSITPTKGLVRLFVGIIVLTAMLTSSQKSQAEQVTGTVRVVDGDTLAFNMHASTMTGSQRLIRLKGIDAPELAQHCLNRKGKPYPCGQVAHQKLTNLTHKQQITCQWTSTGRFQRPLATCWFKRRGRKVSLNQWMVQWGWALVYLSKDKSLFDAQEKAKKHRRGIWQGLFRRPHRWRQFHKHP